MICRTKWLRYDVSDMRSSILKDIQNPYRFNVQIFKIIPPFLESRVLNELEIDLRFFFILTLFALWASNIQLAKHRIKFLLN